MSNSSVSSSSLNEGQDKLRDEKKQQFLEELPRPGYPSLMDLLTPLHASRPLSVFQSHWTGSMSEHEIHMESGVPNGWDCTLKEEEHLAGDSPVPAHPASVMCSGPNTVRRRSEEDRENVHAPHPVSHAVMTEECMPHVSMVRLDSPVRRLSPPLWRSRSSPSKGGASTDGSLSPCLLSASSPARNQTTDPTKAIEATESSEDEEDVTSFCIDPASPLFRPRPSVEWRRQPHSPGSLPMATSTSPFRIASTDPSGTFTAVRHQKGDEKSDEGPSTRIASVPNSVQSSSSTRTEDGTRDIHRAESIFLQRNQKEEPTVTVRRRSPFTEVPLIRLDDTEEDDGEQEENSRRRLSYSQRTSTLPQPPPPQRKRSPTTPPTVKNGELHSKDAPHLASWRTAGPLIRLDDTDEEEEGTPNKRVGKGEGTSLQGHHQRQAKNAASGHGRSARSRNAVIHSPSELPKKSSNEKGLLRCGARTQPVATTSTSNETSYPPLSPPKKGKRLSSSMEKKTICHQHLSTLLFDRNRSAPACVMLRSRREMALVDEKRKEMNGKALGNAERRSTSCSLSPPLYAQRVALYTSLALLFDPASYATKKGFQAAVEHTFSSSHILTPNTFWSLFIPSSSSSSPPDEVSPHAGCSSALFLSHAAMGSLPSTASSNPVDQAAVGTSGGGGGGASTSYFPLPVEYVGEGSFGLVWKASVPQHPTSSLSCSLPAVATPLHSVGRPTKEYKEKVDPSLSVSSLTYYPVCIKSCPLFFSTKAHREDAVTTLREVAILTLLQMLEEEEKDNKERQEKRVAPSAEAKGRTSLEEYLQQEKEEGEQSEELPFAMRRRDHYGGISFPLPSSSLNVIDLSLLRVPHTLPLYSAFYVPAAAEALPPDVREAVRWRRVCQRKAEMIAAEEIRGEERDSAVYTSKKRRKTLNEDDEEHEMGKWGRRVGVKRSREEVEALPHGGIAIVSLPGSVGKSFEARVEDILEHRLADIEREWEAQEAMAKEEEKSTTARGTLPRRSREGRRPGAASCSRGAWRKGKPEGFVTSTGEHLSCTAARQRYSGVRCPVFLSLTAQDALQCDGTLFMVMEYCHGDVEQLARQPFQRMLQERSVRRSRERERGSSECRPLPPPCLLPPSSSSSSCMDGEASTQELIAPSVPSPGVSLMPSLVSAVDLTVRLPSSSTIPEGEKRQEEGEEQQTSQGQQWGPRLFYSASPSLLPPSPESVIPRDHPYPIPQRVQGSPLPLFPSSRWTEGHGSTVHAEGSIDVLRANTLESLPRPPPPRSPTTTFPLRVDNVYQMPRRRRKRRRRWLRYWYRRPLPHDLLLSIASCVSEALAGLHALGLIHLDLKPSNILYTAMTSEVSDKEHNEKGRPLWTCSAASPLVAPSFSFYISDFGNCQLLPLPSFTSATTSTPTALSGAGRKGKTTAVRKEQHTAEEHAETIEHEESDETKKSAAHPLAPDRPCRFFDKEERAVSNAIGTYAYMDPIALSRLQASTPTDCFSLGATLFELAFGRRIYGLVHQHRQMRTQKRVDDAASFVLSSTSPSHVSRTQEGEETGTMDSLTLPQRPLLASSSPSITLGLEEEEEEEKDREWYSNVATFYAAHHHDLWSLEIVNEELIGMVIRYFVDHNRPETSDSPSCDPATPALPLVAASPLCCSFTFSSSSSAGSQQWDRFFSSHNALCSTTISHQAGTVSTAKSWLSAFFNEILHPLLKIEWGERMSAAECASRLRDERWKRMLDS